MATPSLTDEITAVRDERDSKDWVVKLPEGQGIGRVRVGEGSYEPKIFIEVDGDRQLVGKGNEDTGGYDDWSPFDEDGFWYGIYGDTFPLIAEIDEDSSAIIGTQNLNQYDGLPFGEGKWIVDGNEQPVTVTPGWIDPDDFEVRGCSVSDDEPTVGDTVTVEATVFNTSYNPMKCDAEVFVGNARETVAVTTDGRGNTGTQQQRVSASFEVTQPGSVDYGVDLTNITHNYS